MSQFNFSEDILQEAIEYRHQIHENPELSGQEYQTTSLIKDVLTSNGINVFKTPLKTGVIAEIGENDGPIIALRADIDALPIEEATSLAFKSKNPGVMHACGHDFHTASLLGAAKIINTFSETLNGKVRLLFQHSEEANAGANDIISAGGLKDVSAIFGYHNKPDLPVGTIGVKSGPLMAAVDQFKIVIKGTGTHAAAPHNGNDPIVTACQIVTNAQSIVSRHISPISSAVLSISHIEGGNTWNVIPEDVILEGTIRTFSSEDQQIIRQLFEGTIEHTVAMYGQSVEIDWISNPPVVMNDVELTVKEKSICETFANVVEPDITLGGEDFANYQQVVPGFFAFIGTGSPFEWHHPSFLVNDEALGYAISYYVETVKSFLT